MPPTKDNFYILLQKHLTALRELRKRIYKYEQANNVNNLCDNLCKLDIKKWHVALLLNKFVNITLHFIYDMHENPNPLLEIYCLKKCLNTG